MLAVKPLVWLHGDIKTPPFSADARIEAGVLLRRLQGGQRIGMPHSRPLTTIGRRCHELRIQDQRVAWRIICRLDEDAVVIAEVFAKTTRRTPSTVIEACRQRLRRYDEETQEEDG